MTDFRPLPPLASGGPLYAQLADALADHILRNNLPKGHRLPSQSELMATYGVSQATVRQAFLNLSNRGLIRARHGKGVFVDEPRMHWSLNGFGVLTKADGTPSTTTFEHLSSEVLFATTRLAEILQLTEDAQICRIRRHIRADMRLIGLETSNMALNVHQLIDADTLRTGDLRSALARDDIHPIARSTLKIGGGLITDFDREALGVSADSIVLQREETFFDPADLPIFMQRSVLLATHVDLTGVSQP